MIRFLQMPKRGHKTPFKIMEEAMIFFVKASEKGHDLLVERNKHKMAVFVKPLFKGCIESATFLFGVFLCRTGLGL